MTLALTGKSGKRRGILAIAALLAVVAAIGAAMMFVSVAFAHHLEMTVNEPSCDDQDWSVHVTTGGWSQWREAVLSASGSTTINMTYDRFVYKGATDKDIVNVSGSGAVDTSGTVTHYQGSWGDGAWLPAINAATTTLTRPAGFPYGPWPAGYVAGQIIKIDDEVMKIQTRVDNQNLTVTRGWAYSAAVAHPGFFGVTTVERWSRGAQDNDDPSKDTRSWNLHFDPKDCTGHIKITKRVVNVEDDPFEFDFSISPGDAQAGDLDFELIDDQVTMKTVTVGSQTVTEDDETGYTELGWAMLTSSTVNCPDQMPTDVGGGVQTYGSGREVDVSVLSGGTVTLCFYNRRDVGHLVVHKVITGPQHDTTSFGFTITTYGPTNFNVAGGSSHSEEVPAGSQTVQENQPLPSNYDYLGWALGQGTNGDTKCPDEPDHTGDYSAEVNVPSGGSVHVCFYNEPRAKLKVYKVVTNVDDDATEFSFALNGDPFLLSESGSPAEYEVIGGGTQHEVEEKQPLPAGYEYLGWAWAKEGCPDGPLDDTATDFVVETTPDTGQTIGICFYNRAVGTVVLIKNETHPTAGSETWHFKAEELGDPMLTTAANPGPVPSTTSAQQTFTNVPVGNFSISEAEAARQCLAGDTSDMYSTYVKAGAPGGPIPNPADPADLGGTTGYTVAKGETTYIVYENIGCGTVLSSQNLIVHKYNDPAGDMSGTTGLGGWQFRITGTSGAATGFTATQSTLGSGTTVFSGIPDGTYTVLEHTQAGWEVIGSDGSGGEDFDEEREGVPVKLDLDSEVSFYNRQLVTIRVHKTEKFPGGSEADGEGWDFTLKGCGVNESGSTDGSGEIVWEDLPVADGCSYTIEEDQKGGWRLESPGSGHATVSPGAGADIKVEFVNRKLPQCTENCEPTTRTEPTPTPTSPPPPPTATPTPIETVRGAITPGLQATPVAPSAGSGLASSGSGNVLFALLGLVAISGGLVLVTVGRKR